MDDAVQVARSPRQAPPRRRRAHWPHLVRTVVFGSVIMKKTKSWYIGPVIGATAASQGSPVDGAAHSGEDQERDDVGRRRCGTAAAAR